VENRRVASSKYYSEHKKVLSNRRKLDLNETVSIKKPSADKRLKRSNNTIRESKCLHGSKGSWVKQRIPKKETVYDKENLNPKAT
ncbi:19175_t:CDS:1, partial [Dentiscutata erythropus]